MKYEVDKWYPWMGGKCPVHDKTEVICMFRDGAKVQGLARQFSWSRSWSRPGVHCDINIIAFKVVDEYNEPREWWALVSHQEGLSHIMFDTREEAEKKRNYRDEIVKVRELKE